MKSKNTGILMMMNYGLVVYSLILELIIYGTFPNIFIISGGFMMLYGLYVIFVK